MNTIRLIGVECRNLHDLSLEIPLGKITVITGRSGAGKHSLAVRTLFAEGYARYLESLSPEVRRALEHMPRPEVAAVENLPPAVAFRMSEERGRGREVAAEAVGLMEYLALWYIAAADFSCPRCGRRLRRYTVDEVLQELLDAGKERFFVVFEYTGDAASLRNRGYYFHLVEGERREIDSSCRERPLLVVADEIGDGGADRSRLYDALDRAAAAADRLTVVDGSGRRDFPLRLLCPDCRLDFPDPQENWFSFRSAAGACPACRGEGADRQGRECPGCGGARFAPRTLSFRLHGLTPADFLRQSVDQALRSLESWPDDPLRTPVDVVERVRSALGYLQEVGLGYLTLDRPLATLSRGEAHRIVLSPILGAPLADTLLVLEYPAAGLHPAEIARLGEILLRLRRHDNTIVVIEHEPAVLRLADHIVELGPGGGADGGRVVWQGAAADYPAAAGFPPVHREPPPGWWRVTAAAARNLRSISFSFPRGGLTLVTGVSGAGKTTLLHEEILPRRREWPGLRRAVFVPAVPEAVPDGRSVADFCGFSPLLRRFFAGLKQSRLLSFLPAHFSPSSPAGRCPQCLGRGRTLVGMDFLPAVHLPCPICGGSGFRGEVLRVTRGGRSIADILNEPVSTLLPWLQREIPEAAPALAGLADFGLGHLPPGRRWHELASGERQLLRLWRSLSADSEETLFLLDEPATGLHAAEAGLLAQRLLSLSGRGNTIVAAERHPALLACADWIVELGPGAGAAGGEVIFQGTSGEFLEKKRKTT